MKKVVQSSFTFGIMLVTVGLIGHFLAWKQANIIILLGIVFEMFAALIFIWNKLKGNH